LTFIESWSTTIVGRGVFFLSAWALSFNDVRNLWLAAAYGTTYVVGAFLSHRCCFRLGEKRMLVLTGAAQLAAYLALWRWLGPGVLFALFSFIGFTSGLRWPVVESYLSAGRTPRQTMGAIGTFNLCWAAGIPLALLTAGWLIHRMEASVFLLPACVNAASLLIILPLPFRPVHLPADHPARPGQVELARMKALTTSSRWLLLASYALSWALAGLMPHVFGRMGFVESAPALSGVLDFVRLLTFAGLIAWTSWHGKVAPLLLSLAAMPIGFFMVLFGGSLGAALTGETIFGLGCGLVYYSALYHAMVVQNASVDASGKHESLIGLGLVAGPLAGLLGAVLSGPLGGQVYGMLLGMGPVFLVCGFGSVWALRSLAGERAGASA